MQISHLSRVWQMLLKAVPEVAQAGQPIQALEMALIRICFAATLPPLEDLAKRGPGTDTNAQGAMISAPAHTPAPTAQMRVVSTNTAPRIDTVAAPSPQAATMSIADMRALVALCEEKNEPMLAADLYANAQLVKMQQGQIELVLAKGVSKDITAVLGKKLHEWTGQRWIVAVANSGGQQSLHAQDMAQKNTRIDDAYNDKAITPWKKHFPTMKITDLE
jgi:DNA polymerase-3 subunit gamma/tau